MTRDNQQEYSSAIYKYTTKSGTFYSYTTAVQAPGEGDRCCYSPGPGCSQTKGSLPSGDITIVGQIHSHSSAGADPNSPSKETISGDGDEGIIKNNSGLSHYLLTPNCNLTVVRGDDDGNNTDGEQENSQRTLIAYGIGLDDNSPGTIRQSQVKGPNKTADDFVPVNNDDPIPGKRGNDYDPNIYRPPGYNDPNGHNFGYIHPDSIAPPWTKPFNDKPDNGIEK